MIKSAALAVTLALGLVIIRSAAPGLQVRAEYDVGALELLQSLRRLQTTASVMHTGAHPDDEDSADRPIGERRLRVRRLPVVEPRRRRSEHHRA